MSYVVSVRREDGTPITYSEFVEAISGDAEFSLAPESEGVRKPSFVWTAGGTGSQTFFHFWTQEIAVESPSGGALKKLQELAQKLDAEVYGEEGEILSEINPLDVDSPDDGGVLKWFLITLGLLIILVLIYWWTQ